jgi:hypothetical protein
MMLSTGEAAAAVGMTKQGILAAIHKGRLSATRDNNGRYEVDPAELFRVYDPLPTNGNSAPTNGKTSLEASGNETATTPEEPCESGRQQMALLREMLAMQDDVIADLRTRLDMATEENQRLAAVVTSQLAPPQPQRKGWWARLLGGRE